MRPKLRHGVLHHAVGMPARVNALSVAHIDAHVHVGFFLRLILQKQDAGFGYTGVRGLNAMLTTLTSPGSAPLVLESWLRRGATYSGNGSARQLARALATAGEVLADGQRPCPICQTGLRHQP